MRDDLVTGVQTCALPIFDQYTLLHLVGDMVGLVDALGAGQAIIAGHDWGAPVAWTAAQLRPDRFRAVIGLGVPFRPRGDRQSVVAGSGGERLWAWSDGSG